MSRDIEIEGLECSHTDDCLSVRRTLRRTAVGLMWCVILGSIAAAATAWSLVTSYHTFAHVPRNETLAEDQWISGSLLVLLALAGACFALYCWVVVTRQLLRDRAPLTFDRRGGRVLKGGAELGKLDAVAHVCIFPEVYHLADDDGYQVYVVFAGPQPFRHQLPFETSDLESAGRLAGEIAEFLGVEVRRGKSGFDLAAVREGRRAF